MKTLRLLNAVALAALMASPAVYASSSNNHHARISRAQAEKIALAKEPGTIKTGEVEKEHGRTIYSFDVQTKDAVHEVNVDVYSGKVVEDSIESPADEAQEAQQDNNAPKI